ncbi:GGDEF domain-containing protein, partial [Acinetobacter baumannii]
EEANGRLATIAITDELTGAFNRRHFNQIFFQDMRGGQGKGLHLALCILDVDHFKHYNDQYGHPAGDQVLSNISHVLNHRL